MIKYKGKEFTSILQLSKYLNTPDSAIARYYRLSISQSEFEGKIDTLLENKKGKEEALNLVNRNYGTDFKGTTKAYEFIVTKYNLRTSLLIKPDGILEYQYIQLFFKMWGTEFDWVLRKDGEIIKYDGMEFKDLRNLLAYYKVTVPKFLKSLYLRDGNVKLALLDNTDDLYGKVYKPIVKGVQFDSVSDLARHYSLNEVVYKRLIRLGYTDDGAYEFMVEGRTLQNLYFPLETSIGKFHTVDDFMQKMGVTITKIRTMLDNNTVEKNIELMRQGLDINSYIDRETEEIFPLKYRGTWINNGKQFLEYFGLDGRKNIFYRGLFSSSDKINNYIRELEAIEVLWEGKSHYTLKSLYVELNNEYKIHYRVVFLLWEHLIKTTLTPILKHDYILKNLENLKEKSKMFTIDGKEYANMSEIAHDFNYTQTTIKTYIMQSNTYEEFYKKLKG